MSFKASDIKVTIKMKRIINLFKLLILYRIQIANLKYHYFLAFWCVFSIRCYWLNFHKSYPFLKLRRASKFE